MTPSHAFIARTRLPNTVPGPRKVIRAERLPGSVTLEELEQAKRSYTVQHKPALDGTGRHWHLWISGQGHWCVGSNGKGGPGAGGSYPTEERAHEVGKLWVRTGRTGV